MATPTEPPTLAAAIEAIWDRHQPELVLRVELLEEAVEALSARRLGQELRAEAESVAHTLAGSLGTFGLADGSQAARELEKAFSGTCAAVPAPARHAQLVAALRVYVERGPARAPRPGAD